MFPDLSVEVDDLFLLEAHQIADLPERALPRSWSGYSGPLVPSNSSTRYTDRWWITVIDPAPMRRGR